jgi:hypothetical protein
MDKLNFYRQKRRDGGVRTGIEFNDEPVWEIFEPGNLPQESALLWFVDVRCSGENLPNEPELIRSWLLQRSHVIQSGLQQLAKDLVAGIDPDWPIRRPVVTEGDVRITIYCSAMRRLSGTEISDVLADVAKSWPDTVRNLCNSGHSVSTNG